MKTALVKTGKILVVDDNEMNRDALSRRLNRLGYEICEAESGHRALAMIEENRFDLILLDILMPGLSGLEVLQLLRQVHSPSQLPIILATALSESEDVVRGLSMGANDYITKPIDFPIVKARVETQLALKLATKNLEVANDRMQRSLNAAFAVQQAGLPNRLPELGGFRFDWRFEPCDELAGDGLHVREFGNRWVSICLWDVSGHGVPAALLSVSIAHILNDTQAGSVRLHNEEDAPFAAPRNVIQRLNELFPMERTEHFVTMIYGVLDTHSGSFIYSSAGHCNPIHLSAKSDSLEPPLSGLPIGLGYADTEGYDERTIELSKGDRLYLYSDGMVEEMNDEDQSFGELRLKNSCEEQAVEKLENVLDHCLELLRVHANRPKFVDDVTLLAVQRE